MLGEVTALRTDVAAQVLVRPTPAFNASAVALVPVPSVCSAPRRLCGTRGARGRTGGPAGLFRHAELRFCQLIPGLLSAAQRAVCEQPEPFPSPDMTVHAAYLSSNSSPGQGHAFGNAPFFGLIQLCLVWTCPAMLSRLTVHL